MALVESHMLELGTKAPDFFLPDTEGNKVGLDVAAGKQGLLVIFMCNHCPYVQHVAPELTRLARDYAAKEIAIVGINANDHKKYPDDAPDKMREEKAKQAYPFPYLFDASQDSARAYRAACTPDFYLFDSDLKLVYRGRLDETRPNGDAPHGRDLRGAIEKLLQGENIPAQQQMPSIGCSIKWRANGSITSP